jgi:hypothetical protein
LTKLGAARLLADAFEAASRLQNLSGFERNFRWRRKITAALQSVAAFVLAVALGTTVQDQAPQPTITFPDAIQRNFIKLPTPPSPKPATQDSDDVALRPWAASAEDSEMSWGAGHSVFTVPGRRRHSSRPRLPDWKLVSESEVYFWTVSRGTLLEIGAGYVSRSRSWKESERGQRHCTKAQTLGR